MTELGCGKEYLERINNLGGYHLVCFALVRGVMPILAQISSNLDQPPLAPNPPHQNLKKQQATPMAVHALVFRILIVLVQGVGDIV